MSEGGTHGMTKRLKEYTREKRLGTTALVDIDSSVIPADFQLTLKLKKKD